MTGYKLACCDCGLVHDVEFRVLRVVGGDPNGTYDAEETDPNEFRVEMRVRRNNRSTGQIRRQGKRRAQEAAQQNKSEEI